MDTSLIFLTLGGLLLAGMLTDEVGRRTRLPRVTLMILVGIAAGPSGFDLLPRAFHEWYEFLASAALAMVAFLLGGRLSLATLRLHGRAILVVSIAVVIATAIMVSVGLVALGVPVVMALLLAGIATATDPISTADVCDQSKARGAFTDTLLGIVAIDDAWGLFVFSLLLLAARTMVGHGTAEILVAGLWEIGGAIALGVALGVPAALLTGRLHPGQPIQAEALGVVFLCAGLALWLEVSFLLAGMTTGAIIANLAKHHERAFHEIENIELPFMVLFFVLAGAALDLDRVGDIGLLGLAYLVLRVLARVVGGWIGGGLAGVTKVQQNWYGLAMMPQAGVALGMALIAANNFPNLAPQLLAVTIGTTILFELVGPVLTMAALRKVGDARSGNRD